MMFWCQALLMSILRSATDL